MLSSRLTSLGQAKQASPLTVASVSRRQIVESIALSSLVLASPSVAAKAPAGYTPVVDQADGYAFNYPFGWQEVSINGADIVFKDVVEPLETVSVTMIKSDKTSISDYGSLEDVSSTLARSVLSAPGTDVKILSSTERADEKGRKYYELEFVAKTNFTRHQLAVVTVANGRFYTLTTGSSERRWDKMKDKLQGTMKSFNILY